MRTKKFVANKTSVLVTAGRLIRKNAVVLVVLFLVVLGVIAVYSFKASSLKKMNNKASFAFSQAQDLADYQNIVQNYPLSRVYVPALINMGSILSAEGKYDEAIHYLSKVVQNHKDSYLAPRALCDLGYVFVDKSDYKSALACFSGVIKDYRDAGWNNEAIYNVARCYELLGDKSQAGDIYKTILARSPGSEWYNDVKFRLRKLEEEQ
ncbi:tol-pal system YbgF family protein [Candidatus Auribacterota bacterium]